MEDETLTEVKDLKSVVKESGSNIIDLLKNLLKEMEVQNSLLGSISEELENSK